MLEYDELQRLLKDMTSGIDAAECHGFLTGYLCVSDTIDARVWEFICADMDGDSPVTEHHRDVIYDLGRDISRHLLSDEFDFQPMQPDNTVPVTERCMALSHWCHGFLSGLGVAGTIDWSGLSEQCQETVSDISEIARLDPAPDNMTIEETEKSIAELGEYVRLGAIYIHDEFAVLKAESENPGVLH